MGRIRDAANNWNTAFLGSIWAYSGLDWLLSDRSANFAEHVIGNYGAAIATGVVVAGAIDTWKQTPLARKIQKERENLIWYTIEHTDAKVKKTIAAHELEREREMHRSGARDLVAFLERMDPEQMSMIKPNRAQYSMINELASERQTTIVDVLTHTPTYSRIATHTIDHGLLREYLNIARAIDTISQRPFSKEAWRDAYPTLLSGARELTDVFWLDRWPIRPEVDEGCRISRDGIRAPAAMSIKWERGDGLSTLIGDISVFNLWMLKIIGIAGACEDITRVAQRLARYENVSESKMRTYNDGRRIYHTFPRDIVRPNVKATITNEYLWIGRVHSAAMGEDYNLWVHNSKHQMSFEERDPKAISHGKHAKDET